MADEEFEKGDAGSSLTFPMACGSLRKNGFVMLKDHPCKIVDISTSKTGKHGSAKAHITGLDIFTGKKCEELCPTSQNMEVPNVVRVDYSLLDISGDGYLSLMTDSGETKEDLKVPDGELGEGLRADFAAGKELLCTVQGAMNIEAVITYKEAPRS